MKTGQRSTKTAPCTQHHELKMTGLETPSRRRLSRTCDSFFVMSSLMTPYCVCMKPVMRYLLDEVYSRSSTKNAFRGESVLARPRRLGCTVIGNFMQNSAKAPGSRCRRNEATAISAARRRGFFSSTSVFRTSTSL